MTARGVKRAMPAFVEPMAAQIVQSLPEGREWIYEAKLDGYRALLIKNGPDVRIRSRNDKDLTRVYPGVHAAALKLHARSAVVDGEIVAVDEAGHPSFQALQHRGAHPGHTILFFAFDLLHLDGADLTGQTLERRRTALRPVVGDSGILLSETLPGTAARVTEAVRALGLEGVIAKRLDSRYGAGQRTAPWVKLKLDKQQEFVVGGYRPGPHGVDALLVGVYAGKDLRFAGKVRNGFTPHVRRDVAGALRALHADRCPFADLPSTRASHWGGGVTAEQMREMQWVRPKVLAQIRFVEWTSEGHLRHASFLGLRTDKSPRAARRETLS